MDVVKQGVYALFDGEELVYIGQSNNLYYRIGQHINDNTKVFDSFEVFELPTYNKADIDDIEITLISWFNPKFNIRCSEQKQTHHHTKRKFYVNAINKIIDIKDEEKERLQGADWIEHRTLCKDCAKNQANKIKYGLEWSEIERVGICHTPFSEKSDVDGCTFGKLISESKDYQRHIEWVKEMAIDCPNSKWSRMVEEWQVKK